MAMASSSPLMEELIVLGEKEDGVRDSKLMISISELTFNATELNHCWIAKEEHRVRMSERKGYRFTICQRVTIDLPFSLLND